MSRNIFCCFLASAAICLVGCGAERTSGVPPVPAATVAASTGAVVGKPCPSFAYKDMNGKAVSLADYKGRAVLLDVWSMT